MCNYSVTLVAVKRVPTHKRHQEMYSLHALLQSKKIVNFFEIAISEKRDAL